MHYEKWAQETLRRIEEPSEIKEPKLEVLPRRLQHKRKEKR